MQPVTRTYAEIRVGDSAEFEETITHETVDAFAQLSGDHNPLHMDEHFAAQTATGSRIAHGMLGGAFFSRLIGMHLPGTHALYLSQTLAFHKPLRLGRQVRVRGEVTHKSDATCTLTLHTAITDTESGETLTDGVAVVKLMP